MTSSKSYRVRFRNEIISEFQRIGISKDKLEMILNILANGNCLTARGHYLIRKTQSDATISKEENK